jgi:hypothetical protein
MTTPPRPPRDAEPPPCAPGKAAGELPGFGAGVGVGLGVGVGTGVGANVGARQFVTATTGTVPADEKSTVQPGGVTTCIATVTLTTPLDIAVVDASIGAGICPREGTALVSANKILNFFIIIINLF